MKKLQKRDDLPHGANNELAGLKQLNARNCTAMPTLVDHFQEKQSEEIWAPVVNLHQMSFTDYETTRRAFKEAYGYVSHSPSLLLSIVMTVLINQLTLYRECLRFKVLNVARSWDNLLWDADNDNWLTIPIFPMVRFCHTK